MDGVEMNLIVGTTPCIVQATRESCPDRWFSHLQVAVDHEATPDELGVRATRYRRDAGHPDTSSCERTASTIPVPRATRSSRSGQTSRSVDEVDRSHHVDHGAAIRDVPTGSDEVSSNGP